MVTWPSGWYSNKLRYFTNIGTAQKPNGHANISLFDINLPSASTYIYLFRRLWWWWRPCYLLVILILRVIAGEHRIAAFLILWSTARADSSLVFNVKVEVSSPALGDIDHDGDLDLFIGDKIETMALDNLNNQSTDNSNLANPFARFPTTWKSIWLYRSDRFIPALADIDGDSVLIFLWVVFRGFTYCEIMRPLGASHNTVEGFNIFNCLNWSFPSLSMIQSIYDKDEMQALRLMLVMANSWIS